MHSNKTIKISVLMSVHNGSDYLKEAIQSVLDQTFEDFEFIIVDDGSTDETAEIIKGFSDERIVHINNNKNIGLTLSLNRALSLAKGEYIARIDADDVYTYQKLMLQSKFLDHNKSHGLVASSTIRIDQTGKEIQKVSCKNRDLEICSLMVSENPFVHGSVMVRRDLVLKVGGYRNHFVTTQDFDLWVRIAEVSFTGAISEYLYLRRMHSERIGVRNKEMQKSFTKDVIVNLKLRALGGQDDFGYSIPGEYVSPEMKWIRNRWSLCVTNSSRSFLSAWLQPEVYLNSGRSPLAVVIALYFISYIKARRRLSSLISVVRLNLLRKQ